MSTNTSSANSTGKYQISAGPTVGLFHVIDTETGVVKTFEKNNGGPTYYLVGTTITQ